MVATSNAARAASWSINVAIAVIAVLIFTRFWGWPTATPTKVPPAERLISPGIQIAAAESELAALGPAVILFVSPDCPVCNQAAESLARLVDLAHRSRVVALVGRESEKALKAWAESNGIRPTRVLQISNPTAAGFLMTPTALLADEDGTVTDFWSGLMPEEIVAAFERRLRRPPVGPPIDNAFFADEVTATALTLLERDRTQNLDIRERGAYAPRGLAEKNIPMDELRIRAPIELSLSRPVAVLCEPAHLTRCRAAGRQLRVMGFSRVLLVKPR